jgi:hypothetical protein
MADAEPAVISANLGPAPATVSDLNKKIYGTIRRRNRPIEGEHPYVYPDGIVLSAPGLARCATCRFPRRSRIANDKRISIALRRL